MAVLDSVLRMGEGRTLRKLNKVVTLAAALEPTYQDLSDAELKELTADFRSRHESGESLEALMPEAFAVVREASVRTLGLRHFDVQLLGGAALFHGNIAEMKTGEGKTLVATLPAYLAALSGKGVHIVTVNDYLAHYQSDLMGRIFRFLGLETGCLLAGQDPEVRRAQYAADITYGTNNEFGFDYLRDNMARRVEDLVQRDHNFAIVDEVDSILIDEARTPLIISGPASGDNNRYYGEFAKLAKKLVVDEDYEVDEKKRTVGILEPGIDKVEKALGIENLYDSTNTALIGFLNNSIRAKELFKRDRDYVVNGSDVDIVDEHTGRLLKGRRYSEGLHQAIEAKEGVAIKAENQTYASITLQNYFRMYETLAGMTGTAQTEAAELHSTYGMNVLPIPTNLPMIREDFPDLLYKNEAAKFSAIVEDILERNQAGQPVLVGTVSVEKSERLSKELKRHGIKHNVLNAKQHEKEAGVIAEAGRKGAVTVATNMAGRGTDIILGGNPEFRAVATLASRGIDAAENPEKYEAEWDAVFEKETEATEAEREEVLDAGGLYVLGTERHESRRIDNQLRGRSGRQGDPGESRFYLSLEDDLMRMFQSSLAMSMMNSGAIPDDVPIESKVLTRGVRSAQSQIEGRNAEIRKNVLKYDDIMNSQRTVIYAERRKVLEGEDLEAQMREFADDVIREFVVSGTALGAPEEWDLDGTFGELQKVIPLSVSLNDLEKEAGGKESLSPEFLEREWQSDAQLLYDAKEKKLGEDVMRNVERQVLLQVLDAKWREHLYEMDYLREGIGLRAMGQRDPLIEYQREGFQLFEAMTDSIKEAALQVLYRVEKREEGAGGAVQAVSASSAAATATQQSARSARAPVSVSGSTGTGGEGVSFTQMTFSGPSQSGSSEANAAPAKKASADGQTFEGVGRNEQCPCGSGKKYKLCHGRNA